MSDTGDDASRLTRWQGLTVGLLLVGYTGYYLCRSHLAVCLPLIRAELVAGGLGEHAALERLGWIVSLGTVAYSLGKFFSGSLTDFLGGRTNYLAGMAGAVVFTLAFAMGGTLPVFTMAWFGNRLIQSIGWPGMVKITSRWFSYSTYGTVMGIISLSYLFGDAGAKWLMGRWLASGLGWRGVFFRAAATLGAIFVVNLLLVRESPRRLGLSEPATNPANLFGEAGQEARPPGLGALLRPLLRSPAFWLVCGLSMGLTLLRESMNNWTNTYLVDRVRMSASEAADASALFPLLGGVSVILAGVLSDRLGRGGRAAIILVGLILAGGVLALLGLADPTGSRTWPVVLIAAVGFLLIGPYSFLAGAISLDFGGKRGSATASGLIDGFGYLGGVAAGIGVSRVERTFGWSGVFVALAIVAAASAAVAAVYLVEQLLGRRESRGDEPVHPIEEIVRLFERRGREAYFGEPVSQAEHALQAARLAEIEGAHDALIAAALLHDVGHLLHDLGEDVADRGHDARHEELGSDWLAARFGPEVVEPVRLHVAAKRYLCTVDPAYYDGLSPASKQSLALQGGPARPRGTGRLRGEPLPRRRPPPPPLGRRRQGPRPRPYPASTHYRSRLESALRRDLPT